MVLVSVNNPKSNPLMAGPVPLLTGAFVDRQDSE
jgi:hypothetical protein